MIGRPLSEGYRVTVSNIEAGDTRDITHLCSGLKYGAVLPGGFESATFNVVFRPGIGAILAERNEVIIHYKSRPVWEGYIEEPAIGLDGNSWNVMALGYGADFKQAKFSALFCDRTTQRFVDGTTLAPRMTINDPPSFQTGVVVPIYGESVAFFVTAGGSIPVSATARNRGAFYLPPPGTAIRNIAFSYLAQDDVIPSNSFDVYGAHGNGRFPSLGLELPQTDSQTSQRVPSGTTTIMTLRRLRVRPRGMIDAPPSETIPYWIVSGAVHNTGASPVVAGSNVGVFFGGLEICGELHPDGGVVLSKDMYADTIVRSIISNGYAGSRLSTSPENIQAATKLIKTLVPEQVYPEEVVRELFAGEGWEWGVFFGRRVYAGQAEWITADGSRAAGRVPRKGEPRWWMVLRRDEGAELNISYSTEKIINALDVMYTPVDGVRRKTTVTSYDDPRNPFNAPGSANPKQVRRDSIDLEARAPDLATALEIGRAIIAERSLPKVRGTVQVPGGAVLSRGISPARPFLLGSSTLGGGDIVVDDIGVERDPIFAPEILPGYWVTFPDLLGADERIVVPVADSEAQLTPPSVLAMIRRVTVDASANIVTLEIGDGADTLEGAL